MKRIVPLLLAFFPLLPAASAGEPELVEEQLAILRQGGANAEAALGLLAGTPPGTRRPMSLLALLEGTCPTKDLAVARDNAFARGVHLAGAWRMREAIPFLLDHVDIRYEDFHYGPRNELESRLTDDYFPCAVALWRIGEDAIVPLMDFIAAEGDTEKGRLAMATVLRILRRKSANRERAIGRLRAYMTRKEKDQIKSLFVFAESWNGSWMLEPPKTDKRR